MKLRVYSDLHIDFAPFEVPFHESESETVLILAGDTAEVHRPSQYKDFYKEMSERFRMVLTVFGNHEYYGDSYLRAKDHFLKHCGDLDNVKLLDLDTVELDNHAFIGCTFWTNCANGNPLVMEQIRYSMNDYNEIRMGTWDKPYMRRLMPMDTLHDHVASKHWVFDEVLKARQKKLVPVVITHHAPSYMSVPEKHAGDVLNAAYATEYFDHIADAGPDLWIHGHIHTACDYMIGNTNVVCNPRGYWTKNKNELIDHEMTGFDPMFTLGLTDE